MKKIFACCLVHLLAITGFSQTETFDIITYTAPKDFKKDSKQGVVNYTNVNTTTGTFCVIALFASSPSSGDAQQDFKNQWNELVATPFSAEELDRLPPKHEARTNPGLVVERSMCRVLDMPPLGAVTNREAVIFDGAPPLVAEGPNV